MSRGGPNAGLCGTRPIGLGVRVPTSADALEVGKASGTSMAWANLPKFAGHPMGIGSAANAPKQASMILEAVRGMQFPAKRSIGQRNPIHGSQTEASATINR